jgi:hypothetical protein
MRPVTISRALGASAAILGLLLTASAGSADTTPVPDIPFLLSRSLSGKIRVAPRYRLMFKGFGSEGVVGPVRPAQCYELKVTLYRETNRGWHGSEDVLGQVEPSGDINRGGCYYAFRDVPADTRAIVSISPATTDFGFGFILESIDDPASTPEGDFIPVDTYISTDLFNTMDIWYVPRP